MHRLIYAISTALTLLLANSAHGQARWAFGLGAEYAPDFPAASDQSVSPTLLIDRLKDGESLYSDLTSGPRIDFLESEVFEAGFALNFDPGRDTDDLALGLIGLGEVDLAVEVGGFVAFRFDPFAVRLDVLTDVADGHGGLIATPSLEWFSDSENRLRFNARIGVDWVDRDYVESYFGVNATQAVATQLARYAPDSGVERSFISAGFAYDLNDHWAMVGSGGFSRWMGDAKDSPITQLGDEDYFSAKFGFMYIW